jgi:hypothetical protein
LKLDVSRVEVERLAGKRLASNLDVSRAVHRRSAVNAVLFLFLHHTSPTTNHHPLNKHHRVSSYYGMTSPLWACLADLRNHHLPNMEALSHGCVPCSRPLAAGCIDPDSLAVSHVGNIKVRWVCFILKALLSSRFLFVTPCTVRSAKFSSLHRCCTFSKSIVRCNTVRMKSESLSTGLAW